MSEFIDANVVLRFLLGDHPTMMTDAARLIESDRELLLTDVALIEVAYVLLTVYRVPRDEIVDTLRDLVLRTNISVPGIEKTFLIQGLEMTRASGRISFGDAMIWAAARSSAPAIVFSFDQRFPSNRVTMRRPPSAS